MHNLEIKASIDLALQTSPKKERNNTPLSLNSKTLTIEAKISYCRTMAPQQTKKSLALVNEDIARDLGKLQASLSR
uniref:Uncharacterized protein n=1 Tax=Nelumbo nucifera TaxID=4432 RepID=A0A822ZCN7_NELNU|nr:TPA_asm: hypothetical protein HUJ06_015764 [Nelumbo nucifera]